MASVISLNSLLESSQVVCLNEATNHSLQSLLKGEGYLESYSDEQLILTLPVCPLLPLACTHTHSPIITTDNPTDQPPFDRIPHFPFPPFSSAQVDQTLCQRPQSLIRRRRIKHASAGDHVERERDERRGKGCSQIRQISTLFYRFCAYHLARIIAGDLLIRWTRTDLCRVE